MAKKKEHQGKANIRMPSPLSAELIVNVDDTTVTLDLTWEQLLLLNKESADAAVAISAAKKTY